VLCAVLGVIVLASVGYALARPYSGLPEGTVVGGVDVSGMSTEEARSTLQDHVDELVDRDLTIRAGSASLVLQVQRLNLVARIDEALTNARDNSTVLGRMRQRLGLADDKQVALRFTVDRKQLENQLKPLSKQVDEPISPAKVRLRDNGQFALQPGKGGLRMDRKVLVAALTDLPKTPDTIEVPIRKVQPAATTQSARNAAAAARKLLESEHVIVLGRTREPIPRKVLAEAIAFPNEGSQVKLRIARPPVEVFLHGVFGAAEKEPQNAQFAVNDDGSVNIVPEVDGRVADADAVARALEENPGRAEVPVQVVSRPATFTAADAKQLGITDQIGDFTTQYIPGEPRVTNIQRAAETIDGTILQPGEAFDLNQRLGERTIEKGYVVAPMIDEGRLRDAVGGGVSQVATTVFNAAYRAGLEIVTHTPHEFWISRYPQGQEATVSWGGPELIFRNDWSAPLVLIAEAGPGAISVRIFSQDLDRRVETGIDPPRDQKPAETREVVNSELEPGTEETVQHGGQEGFTVDYWRKVWRGDELIRDERYSHTYRPEDTIIEKGPPLEEPPEDTTGTGPTESGGTGPTESGPPASSQTPPASEPDAGSQPPASSGQAAGAN
jgi:vancomycin resistance protein YoaR